jgi:hypothetical protein
VIPVSWILQDRFDSGSYAARIKAPTLIIAVENDRVIPKATTDRLVARFPPGQATLGVVVGAEHNFHDDHPDYVASCAASAAGAERRRLGPGARPLGPLDAALGAERLLRAAHPRIDPRAARLAARRDGIEAKQRLEREAGALGDLPAALVAVVHAQLDAAGAERVEGEPRHRPVASVTMPRPSQPVLRQ